MENKYLIKFCDRETGQLLIPFGHIDNLVMPVVKQDYQTVHSLGSKNPMYLPAKAEITPFSATYIDFENNEGGYFFWRYLTFPTLELKPIRLCGSIFDSKEMKMLAYFDDVFIQKVELKYGEGWFCSHILDFSLHVNDWEYIVNPFTLI